MEDFHDTRVDGVDGETVGLFGVFDGKMWPSSRGISYCNKHFRLTKYHQLLVQRLLITMTGLFLQAMVELEQQNLSSKTFSAI